jgi:excisionase family DNA binding protein
MHRDPEYLSVREVAERLHVTTRTIYELLWRGEIEGAKRVGDAVRIPEDALEKLPAYKRQQKGGGSDDS